MIMSLAKPPASAGPLSRRGDYLVAARGPGLFLGIRRRTTTFPYESTVTRGPPYPLFHRRRGMASLTLMGQAPHYLQGSTNPAVSRALLAYVSRLLGLALDVSPFEEAV